MKRLGFWILTAVIVPSCFAQTPDPGLRASYRVRYMASESIYLDGGRNQGLAEGTALVLKPSTASHSPAERTIEPGIVARLVVVSVAANSAVCEVVSTARAIKLGDLVVLPEPEVERLVEKRALSSTRQYPAVVSFTEGDPLDEEQRDAVPKPPLPEVNQASGRLGFDASVTSGRVASKELGAVVRANITRINGTYWNVNGYWRGRLNTTSAPSQPTIQDLLNRTYHIGLTYANPNSSWTAGLGRLYLPWASSLQTIDGAYVGKKVSNTATLGLFAGSTPDPTSWKYDPNRRIAGALLNFQGGSYDQVYYSSTTGVGVSTRGWQLDRPFAFVENTVSYKRTFSIYHSLQVDRPRTPPSTTAVGTGISNSYLSFRLQPQKRITFDVNHTYFRDVPTFDSQLVAFGLLDKVLFQGFSGGVRLELPKRVTLHSNFGRSHRSDDPKGSWNTMLGATMGQVWRTGVTVDARYAKFNSVFTQGSYRSLAFSRNISEASWWEVQLGQQVFAVTGSSPSSSHFLNSHIDLAFGGRYFVEGGFTLQRGTNPQSYNQVYVTFGYRFDNRGKERQKANAAPTP